MWIVAITGIVAIRGSSPATISSFACARSTPTFSFPTANPTECLVDLQWTTAHLNAISFRHTALCVVNVVELDEADTFPGLGDLNLIDLSKSVEFVPNVSLCHVEWQIRHVGLFVVNDLPGWGSWTPNVT